MHPFQNLVLHIRDTLIEGLAHFGVDTLGVQIARRFGDRLAHGLLNGVFWLDELIALHHSLLLLADVFQLRLVHH